jgi:hypothetical protein
MSTEIRTHSCEGCDIKKENTYLRETVEEYEKRLRHLLRSKTIQLFDEWDPQAEDYKRDIRRLDTYGVDKKVLEYDRQRQRPNPNYTPPASAAIQEPKVELASFRPCEVDGKPAFFHRWVEEEKALLKINAFTSPQELDILVRRFRSDSVLPMGTSTEIVRNTFALVEYADGTVGRVEPEKVKFRDRRAE